MFVNSVLGITEKVWEGKISSKNSKRSQRNPPQHQTDVAADWCNELTAAILLVAVLVVLVVSVLVALVILVVLIVLVIPVLAVLIVLVLHGKLTSLPSLVCVF